MTSVHTANRLDELSQRLRALPGRRERAERVRLLSKFNVDTTAAAATWADSQDAQERVRSVFPDSNPPRLPRAAAVLRKAARELHELLGRDLAAIESVRADNRLTEIREQASASRTVVREEWRAQIGRVVAQYKEIVAAAKAAGLVEAQALQVALAALERRQNELPRASDLDLIGRELLALRKEVSSLQLEGKVGAFLRDVAAGRGNPQHLEDGEIREFLTQHNLWRSLAVVFKQ